MKKRLRDKAYFSKGIRCAYAEYETYEVDYGVRYDWVSIYCYCRNAECDGYCKKYKPKKR